MMIENMKLKQGLMPVAVIGMAYRERKSMND